MLPNVALPEEIYEHVKSVLDTECNVSGVNLLLDAKSDVTSFKIHWLNEQLCGLSHV